MNMETQLPDNLPVPIDDGACDHLQGMRLPDLDLETTNGDMMNFGLSKGWQVIYIYPMSGPTNDTLPDNWDSIPGARGCTPQQCSFRDHYNELAKFNAAVCGLSTQSTAYLISEVERLHLPYPLVSDANLDFTHALRLPTFEVRVAGSIVNKRVTLVARDGEVVKVFYPVFPPDRNADNVIRWFDEQRALLDKPKTLKS